MLESLMAELRQSLGILHKQDIQLAAHHLGNWVRSPQADGLIRLGDDCAAIPEGEGYLLLAAEGMWPHLVQVEPWFAGWCSVLVNVSDIYAMGGRAIAVVDALWSASAEQAQSLWEGMKAAAHAFNVPIVGGHSNGHSPYNALAVAILGRATRLITSFNAHPDDVLLMAVDLRGKAHPDYPFWDAATQAPPQRLQEDLLVLPQIAEAGWCDAGKDISMGGVVGTLLMLLEASGCGAVLDLDAVPRPDGVPFAKWLLSFPSYGFLLSVRPPQVEWVRRAFQERQLLCEPVGRVTAGSQLHLTMAGESSLFWDLNGRSLTGFSPVLSSPDAPVVPVGGSHA